jgi:cell division initiation protein
MELTPQTLHAVEFREARRGGYNTRDVDDFIERVAAGVGHLNERLRDAMVRADAADARLAEAQRELEEARRRPPAPEASETDETLRRTLVLAQRTADATIKEAKEEANRVLSEARAEAVRTRAEAEADARRGAEGARAAAEAEVEALIADRDKLKIDFDVLTRRLGEQRANLRTGISELQRILDDPHSLKPVVTPALADVERPTPEPVADGVDDGANGRTPAEVGADSGAGGFAAESPAAGFGAENVPEIQEPPDPSPFAMPPAPPAPPRDLGPPTQPVPFALSNDNRGPWTPSELRPQDDEPLGPPPMPPPPAPGTSNGGSEPAARPSEWGKAVFDSDKAQAEADRPHFGRRS